MLRKALTIHRQALLVAGDGRWRAGRVRYRTQSDVRPLVFPWFEWLRRFFRQSIYGLLVRLALLTALMFSPTLVLAQALCSRHELRTAVLFLLAIVGLEFWAALTTARKIVRRVDWTTARLELVVANESAMATSIEALGNDDLERTDWVVVPAVVPYMGIG